MIPSVTEILWISTTNHVCHNVVNCCYLNVITCQVKSTLLKAHSKPTPRKTIVTHLNLHYQSSLRSHARAVQQISTTLIWINHPRLTSPGLPPSYFLSSPLKFITSPRVSTSNRPFMLQILDRPSPGPIVLVIVEHIFRGLPWSCTSHIRGSSLPQYLACLCTQSDIILAF